MAAAGFPLIALPVAFFGAAATGAGADFFGAPPENLDPGRLVGLNTMADPYTRIYKHVEGK